MFPSQNSIFLLKKPQTLYILFLFFSYLVEWKMGGMKLATESHKFVGQKLRACVYETNCKQTII